MVVGLLLNKFGILTKTFSEFRYYDNPVYDAYESMFELNQSQTDVVFVGDSITFQGAIDEFFPEINQLNRGISGDVTEGLLNRIDEIIAHCPKKVFILIGINDVLKNVKFKDTKENYRKIVEKLSFELPGTTVILQSILPTGLGTEVKVRELNYHIKELADETGVTFIDLYPAFLNSDGTVNLDLFASDKLHLNGKGYITWTEKIRDFVE